MALAEQIRQLALRLATLEATHQQGKQKPTRTAVRRNHRVESRLGDGIEETFNEQELSELAYELGVDYEALLGEGKRGRIRAFVGHFARRGFLEILVNQLAQERPHFDWHAALLDTGEL
ncbi:MAG: hypothetical protein HC804_06875 [Anaerolineae bacterium]|nr:hypothetical protein [Anaerolineae bacterium]